MEVYSGVEEIYSECPTSLCVEPHAGDQQQQLVSGAQTKIRVVWSEKVKVSAINQCLKDKHEGNVYIF